MVTSSVMKDVAGGGRGAGDQEVYRANAIRALCRIIDVSRQVYLRGWKLVLDPECYIGGSLGVVWTRIALDAILSFCWLF